MTPVRLDFNEDCDCVPYRPYLWMGEDADAHVVEFRQAFTNTATLTETFTNKTITLPCSNNYTYTIRRIPTTVTHNI